MKKEISKNLGWYIDRKIVFGFVLIFSVFNLLGLLSYRTIFGYVNNGDLIAKSNTVIKELDLIASNTKDSNHVAQGYLINNEDYFLNRYKSLEKSIDKRITNLQELTTTKPKQQKRISAIKELIDEKSSSIDNSIKKQDINLFPVDHINTIDKALIKSIDEMKDEEHSLLTKQRLSLEKSARNTFTIFIGLILVGFILLFTVYKQINSDIANRKKALETIKESEQKFRQLAENINQVFWLFSPDRKELLYVSPAYEKLWGESSEQLYKNPSSWTEIVHPEDKEAVLNSLENTSHNSNTDKTYRIVKKDGSLRWIQDRTFPVTDTNGEVYRIAGIAEDITDFKLAEEHLQSIAEKLRRSNEELEQFAYVASHDLQEPLRMVSSYCQLLQKRYKDKLDGDAIEFINYAVDGAVRMQRLISDLLSYSRVQRKGKEPEDVNAKSVLQTTLNSLKPAIEESHASITFDELPIVKADPIQLGQLFQNLITNALKFSPKEDTPKVHVSAKRNGHGWIFSVKDNGIGIDPKFSERIFVIFQRLHGKTEYAGTGIGLAICKKIVERHGGNIWVESEPGKGANFCFTIPDKGGNQQ